MQRRIIVKNADGTTKVIQQNITQPARSSTPQQQQQQAQSSPAPAAASTPKPDGPQKVQIIRGQSVLDMYFMPSVEKMTNHVTRR